jgi:hypothetical protein
MSDRPTDVDDDDDMQVVLRIIINNRFVLVVPQKKIGSIIRYVADEDTFFAKY